MSARRGYRKQENKKTRKQENKKTLPTPGSNPDRPDTKVVQSTHLLGFASAFWRL
jgi:hypothetical protein